MFIFLPGEYETENGRAAVVNEVMNDCAYGRFQRTDGGWGAAMWDSKNGKELPIESPYNLTIPKRPATVVLAIHQSSMRAYGSVLEAQQAEGITPIAIKRVVFDYTPGEGL